ncbi:efflux RND transporter periplasmic adaptor subunit [bacterium]|nr:efflux RND transporter periplasmic adaptor subunit [bacterium]
MKTLRFVRFSESYVWLARNRIHIIAALSVIVIASGALLWHHRYAQSVSVSGNPWEQQAQAKEKQRYAQVFRVKRVLFQDVMQGLIGSVKGSSIELKSSQEETLMKYHFKSGDFVGKGRVIAELNHIRSRAKYRQAKINFKRTRALYDVGGASKIEVQEVKETLAIAKKDYDDTFIVAPKDGYLGDCLVLEGELVNRQVPIAYFVSNEDDLFIETSVTERRVKEIQVNQRALVKVDAFPNLKIEGKIMSLSPEVTTTSRMAVIRISISNEYRTHLRPGLSAVCQVITHHNQSIIIPKTALIQGDAKVYIVSENKSLHLRDVSLGYASREYVEIKLGLEENDVIIKQSNGTGLQAGSLIKYGQVDEYQEKEKKML